MREKAFSDGERAAVKFYGANDVLEGVAIMKGVGVHHGITNPDPLPDLVAAPIKMGDGERSCARQRGPRARLPTA